MLSLAVCPAHEACPLSPLRQSMQLKKGAAAGGDGRVRQESAVESLVAKNRERRRTTNAPLEGSSASNPLGEGGVSGGLAVPGNPFGGGGALPARR